MKRISFPRQTPYRMRPSRRCAQAGQEEARYRPRRHVAASAGLGSALAKLQDVLWALVHEAERFPLKLFLAGLVATVPRLAATAPGWARRLTGCLLNITDYRSRNAEALAASSPETRAAVRPVFAALRQHSPDQFGPSVDWIAANIGSPPPLTRPSKNDCLIDFFDHSHPQVTASRVALHDRA